MIRQIFFSLSFILFGSPLFANVISTEGPGYLEETNGQYVLHVKGTPYEMGYQHGKLLKDMIQQNVGQFIDKPPSGDEGRTKEFLRHLPQMKNYISLSLMEEMKGVAEGSGMPFDKILILNLFPEMFHCSGITVNNEATLNGSLYHVRVLDYSIGKSIQKSAVLIIAEPKGKVPFANVSYAGFIGSVTGMNAARIAIGEIGGQGYGHWEGIPMAFLMRSVLEDARSLSEAQSIFQNAPRTCEYYYVISDGNANTSIGVYATASQIHFINPSDPYAILAPKGLPANYGANGDHDKFFLSPCSIDSTPYQTLLLDKEQSLIALMRLQPKDCLLLTGFPHPERYPVLADRVISQWGSIDEKQLIEIIKQPVSRESNLHNAIFLPAQLKMWVAHAGPNNEPACDQPYAEFDLTQYWKDTAP
ncbi:MAG: peptidase C45 [Verrucomicrobia bacterium]|nr:peptidase C45 [Verrucomicrobiota bacterium]